MVIHFYVIDSLLQARSYFGSFVTETKNKMLTELKVKILEH